MEGLGLTMDREMQHDGKLISCIVHNDYTCFLLNQRACKLVKPNDYEGIRLYWAPTNILETWERLKQLGYEVSDLVNRDYGQTEFFVSNDDGYSHCFGGATTPTNSAL